MKKLPALALACVGATLAIGPAAATSAAAAPSPVGTAGPSTMASPAAAASSTQSLAFKFVSARAFDDATYGNAVEVKFTVTNTGTSDGPFSFHVLTPDGKNFLDDEGEEMFTGCDTAVSGLRPGASTTCRTFIRMSAAEVAAGASSAQPIQFQWGTSGPTFPGFTVPSATLGGPAVTPAPAERKALAFAYRTAVVKNDATYGPAVQVTFDVTNTGTTPGPWEFHVLTADGKNFLDDEGEEMYTGCDSAISQLQPGATTTCRTYMRLSAADIAKGESPAMPVTFQWGSTGPTFDGFTVPVLNLSHLAPTPTPTPTPGTDSPSTPAPTPTPGEPGTDSPSTPAPTPTPGEPGTDNPTTPAPSEPALTTPASTTPAPSTPAPTQPTSSTPAPGEPTAPGASMPADPATGEGSAPVSPSKPVVVHPTMPTSGPKVETDGDVQGDDAIAAGVGVTASLTAVAGAALVILRRRARADVKRR